MFKFSEATIVVMLLRYCVLPALGLLIFGCGTLIEPEIDSAPIADFEASTVEGFAPLYVIFSDLSTGQITHWKWDFGDGNCSVGKSPHHIYNEPGTYTISLIVLGPGGNDTAKKVDYIQVKNEIISWQDATNYMGQVKTVEGIVVETRFAPELNGRPTFLNFHKDYQGHFKCMIWYGDRASFLKAFPPNPETHLLNKTVRITGMIEAYPIASGVPEIILKFPSQIEVIGE
jgi:PKD repeat protein